eukprot:696653-Alexandrium_andersonii.AAC.1
MCIRDSSTALPGEQAFGAMSRAAAMDAGARRSRTLFAASPADNGGVPAGAVLRYVRAGRPGRGWPRGRCRARRSGAPVRPPRLDGL